MLDKNLMRESKTYCWKFFKIAILQVAIAFCTVFSAFFLAKTIYRIFLENATLNEVVPFLAVLLLVMSAKAILSWWVDINAYRISLQIQNNLRFRLLKHFFFVLGPIGLVGEKTGHLTACLTDGIEVLDGYFTKFLPQCIAAIVIPPVILAVTLPTDFLTGILFLLTAPLIPVFMFLIGKRAEQANNKQWKKLSQLSVYFLDLLEGLTTLKIFNQSQAQGKFVAEMSDEFRRSTMRVLRVAFLSAFVLELAATISVAIVAVTVGLRLLNNQIMFEQAFFLLLLAPEFYQPLRQLGSAFHNAMSGSVAAEKLYCFFSQKNVMPKDCGTKSIGTCPFSIRFENVNYTYQTERETVLTNLCFTAGAGEHTAIVGISGAGKSTIFQILLGFIKPQHGQIYINEQPLNQISFQILRKNIAYLPQVPHIFNLTVAKNIALGKAAADLDEIIAAAKQAKIHDFICSLPQGYQTILGEGGYALSGGQKQRIAIARAFLQNASLILLDEAMTGLDAETKQDVSESLKKLARGKTMLTITHCLATAEAADKIIVIDNGKTVEVGAYYEVLQKQDLYDALYQHDWRLS